MAIPFQQLEGKYEILEKMSEGGMGAVYKVRHRLLDEIRVIKVMRPHLAEDEVLRKRFVREAKTAIRLRHSNLAQVYDFTMDESGYFFLAMEFIEGIDLLGLTKVSDSVPLGLALEIAHQSLDVIGYLHRKEIVHRDISPDNLLIGRNDEGDLQVKLIDLGIAKVQEGNEHLTATGTFLGKVKYSSPEQFRSQGGRDVDARSDLYSFGVVLYELLTGAYPIKGKNISSLITGHLVHPPLSFDVSDPDDRVPEPLRDVVMRALEKEPAERFQSAADFQQEMSSLRADFPVENEHHDRIFEAQRTPTAKIRVDRPGSTQGRLNRNFGVETTPSQGGSTLRYPDLDLAPGPRGPRSGTESLPKEDVSEDRRSTTDRQIRALLLGAEKLIEAQHFDEARLQLEAAENVDSGRPDVEKLVGILERSDTVMQRRRENAAAEIEALIRAEEFTPARQAIKRLSEELGKHSVFEDLSDAVAQAEQAAAERTARAAEILGAARRLMKNDQWEDAVPMIREALVLRPDDAEAVDLLSQAEKGLSVWLEALRLQAEIERTAAVIESSIQAEDIEGVRQSLRLAEKLYGDHPRFSAFPGQLKDLEIRDRCRRVEELRDQAAVLFENEDFIAASLKLEVALELAPDDQKIQEALAEASERQLAKEELARRTKIVTDTTDGMERLIRACRFKAAYVLLEDASVKLGSFDEEPSLQGRINQAVEIHEALGRRIDDAVSEIWAGIKARDFKRAQKSLEVARDSAKEYPESLGAIDAAATALRSEESRFRREKDIETAVRSVETRINDGQLKPAERELMLARRLYGEEPIFETLATRLLDAQREKNRETHRIKIQEAITAQQPWAEIISLIEAALVFDPTDRSLQVQLIEIRRAEQEESQVRRQPAIDEVLEEVDRSIAQGRVDEALTLLAAAEEEIGPFGEARALRHRLKNG